MKKCLSMILATVILTAICVTACISLVAAAAEKTPVVQITTAKKEAASVNEDGFVAYFPNDTNAAKTITSGKDVALRYINFLVFDGDGKLVAVGNNLLTPEQATDGQKSTVSVPAHGTLVTFDYFVNKDGTVKRDKNQKLWDIYNAALGKDDKDKQVEIFNTVQEVTSNYYLTIDNATTLSVYDGPVSTDTPNESSAASTSSKPTSTSTPASTSSTSAAASSNAPAAGDTGLIIFAILGIIAVAGASLAVRARH